MVINLFVLSKTSKEEIFISSQCCVLTRIKESVFAVYYQSENEFIASVLQLATVFEEVLLSSKNL